MENLYKQVIKKIFSAKKAFFRHFNHLKKGLNKRKKPFARNWKIYFKKLNKVWVALSNLSSIHLYRAALYSVFFVFLLILPGQNKYERASFAQSQSLIQRLPLVIPTPAPYPKNLNLYPPPQLTAKAIMLVELNTQVVLYQKNASLPLPPASTTKIMTALVALDKFKPDQIVTVKDISYQGQIMGLVDGEKITVESLLYGILVHSANDAAQALANAYPGGSEAFVKAMNEKAAKLKLQDSHFTNPVGFDNQLHRMSARDLVKLSSVALKNPLIAKMVSTRSITVSDTSYTYFHELHNVNQLLGEVPGIAGLKTGYTEEAGESLVVLFKRPPAVLIGVILGSQDRFGEMKSLVQWGIMNFTWEELSGPVQSTR